MIQIKLGMIQIKTGMIQIKTGTIQIKTGTIQSRSRIGGAPDGAKLALAGAGAGRRGRVEPSSMPPLPHGVPQEGEVPPAPLQLPKGALSPALQPA